MSFGEEQPMDIDLDEQELQRNRKEESALSAILTMANSDHISDSKRKTLSPITPEMVQALYSENARIQLEAAKEIGKLIGVTLNPLLDEVTKSAIIQSGVVPRFVHFLGDSRHPEIQLESVSVLSNLACGNPARGEIIIESGAVTALGRLLSSPMQNAEVLPHACKALSSLCEDSEEHIQVIIDSGVGPHVVQLLSHSSTKVVSGALYLVCNIVSGNDSQTQVLINANALPAFGHLLLHKKESIVMNACLAFARIMAGNQTQIQSVIDSNLIPSLIKLLHHRNGRIRQLASWAITNATTEGSDEQNLCIVEAGAIAPLCKFLSEMDSDLTKFALSGLENILRTGESFTRLTGSTVNPFATLICNSPEMKVALYSENAAIQLEATKRFSKLLGRPDGFNLLIGEVIKSGIVPRFVHFLENSCYPALQFESALVLTKITRGNSAHTQVIIDAGAVPVLIKQLSASQNECVVKQSVQALRQIAGESMESRNLVLSSNVLPPLLGLFNGGNRSASMMRKVSRTLSCLCTGNSCRNFEQAPQSLPFLARLMGNEDAVVMAHACLALAYLGEDSDEKLQAIVDCGVLPRVIQLLSHSSTKVVEAALRLLFIIITGDDSQTQVLLNSNALQSLGRLLLHEKECIVMEACFSLASITDGTEQQIQAVIDANLIHLLIELLHYGTVRIRHSAAWALANATANGSEQQIVYIVEAGAILPLCNLLYSTDLDLMEEGLICLANILRIGKGIANAADLTENPFANLVKRWAGFDKIAFLSSHNDPKIKEAALTIFKMLSGSKLKYISH